MAKTKIDLLTTGGVLWSLFQKVANAILAVCKGDAEKVNEILRTLNSDDDAGCQLREDVARLVSEPTTVVRKVVDEKRGLEFDMLGRKCIAVSSAGRKFEIGDAIQISPGQYVGEIGHEVYSIVGILVEGQVDTDVICAVSSLGGVRTYRLNPRYVYLKSRMGSNIPSW